MPKKLSKSKNSKDQSLTISLPPQTYDRKTVILVALSLVVVTAIVYGQVASFPFMNNLDDNAYVVQNPHVTSGLSANNIRWAFSEVYMGNYHPLTMISYMVEYELFGLSAGKWHLVNLFCHIVNTVLLFWVLFYVTNQLWPSAFVAGLFALHPLHIESVAWISEHKDVLSTLFWMLTMWAYFRYVHVRKKSVFVVVVILLALGLLAKAMLVSLPLVLILLDWWPLQRISSSQRLNDKNALISRISLSGSIIEKVPLLALVLISAVLAFLAQKKAGAVIDIAHIPLDYRIGNAIIAYVKYVWYLFVPVNLAVYYPLSFRLVLFDITWAALFLIIVSCAVYLARHKVPYVFVGWFWFMVTLVPVIGIVQLGNQAMADRYTYIPHIGLCIALTWVCMDAARKWCIPNKILATLAGVILLALSIGTWTQLQYWKDPVTLYKRTIDVTGGGYVIDYHYATEMYNQKRYEEAIIYFEKALKKNPELIDAINGLSIVYRETSKYEDSVQILNKGLTRKPNDIRLRYNLAMTLFRQEKYTDSFPHFEKALQLTSNDPDVIKEYANALNDYGDRLGQTGQYKEAVMYFKKAMGINPSNKGYQTNLQLAEKILSQKGASSR